MIWDVLASGLLIFGGVMAVIGSLGLLRLQWPERLEAAPILRQLRVLLRLRLVPIGHLLHLGSGKVQVQEPLRLPVQVLLARRAPDEREPVRSRNS